MEDKILLDYLNEKYSFCKFSIHEVFADFYRLPPIYYASKEAIPGLDNSLEKCDPFQLIGTGDFSKWKKFNIEAIKLIANDFIFHCIMNRVRPYVKGPLLKEMIKRLVNGPLLKRIDFPPVWENIIREGRCPVKYITPHAVQSKARTAAQVQPGDTCYVCILKKPPFIANPAHVVSVDTDRKEARIVYFANFTRFNKLTRKVKINGFDLRNVRLDEIGLNPEHAVKNVILEPAD